MQSARPARLAGFVLIGVAVVAVGLGVFALTSNGTPDSQGRPPSVGPTTPPSAPSSAAKPSTTATRQATTTAVGPTTTVAPPPTTTPAQTLEQAVPVRVFNNSRITELGATAGRDITAAGFDVVQVGNYSAGIIPVTTVYYSPLPGEQQIATEIGHDFNMRVEPRFTGIADASPGVIVIVTRDFQAAGK
jgi:LytR cell envelope-related transcriptional attenuator